MSQKQKTRKRIYKTIPVTPAVYAAVVAIAEANHRTQGGQLAYWVERELGGVSVETLPAPEGGQAVPVVLVEASDCVHAQTAPMLNRDAVVCLRCGSVLDSKDNGS